jgi:hypothetical protein
MTGIFLRLPRNQAKLSKALMTTSGVKLPTTSS